MTPLAGKRVRGELNQAVSVWLTIPVGSLVSLRAFGPARSTRGTIGLSEQQLKGLILAQNERWRRGLGMQVERVRPQGRASGARVSKATVTNPMVGHSRGKLRVIPSDVAAGHPVATKALAPWDGPSWY